jgi:hypothetical protein
MQRFSFLGKNRSNTTDLNHGCSQGCHWKGMVDFEFSHFLSVAVIYLKGIWMAWWFKCNPFS